MEGINWGKWASILICLVGGLAGGYLVVRFILPLLLPFVTAYALSLPIRPLAARFSKRTRLPRKLCAVVLLLLSLAALLFLTGVAVQRLMLELQHLLERLLGEGGSVSEMMEHPVDFFEALTSKVDFLQRIGAGERFSAFRERFNAMMNDIISGAVTSLSTGIPSLLGHLIAGIPTFFLVTLVTVIAGFYFCMDGEKILFGIGSHLPLFVRQRLPEWRARVKRISWKYLRAYLFLFGMTVVELFIGFAILRLDYAFLLAITIAFVDLLPIFGVGTVLIPWAIVALLQQNYFLGIGLLILYLAVLILRQIAEPHFLGQSLGLHPLLTIFATYAGWQLFGFLGMLLAPFLALFFKSVLAQRQK